MTAEARLELLFQLEATLAEARALSVQLTLGTSHLDTHLQAVRQHLQVAALETERRRRQGVTR